MAQRQAERPPAQEAGRQMLEAVPRRTGIDEAMRQADSMVSRMQEYSRIVGQGIDRRELADRYAAIAEQMFTSPEAHFKKAESGTAPRVFRSVEEARGDLRREAVEHRTVRPSPTQSGTQGETNREASRVLGWFGQDYLGADLHRRAARNPPVVTEEDGSYFDSSDDYWMRRRPMDALSRSGGNFRTGTNHIIIREGGHDNSKVIAHETLHYLSYLGGGHTIRWRDGSGAPVVSGYIGWLHEGLTELHAQQAVLEHGERAGYVSYPHETAASYYMQKLVGRDALRRAYLTGDFTEVRRQLDARLGEGAFDSIASSRTGVEALTIITGKMSQAGIDFTRWEREPVLSSTFVAIARADERGD